MRSLPSCAPEFHYVSGKIWGFCRRSILETATPCSRSPAMPYKPVRFSALLCAAAISQAAYAQSSHSGQSQQSAPAPQSSKSSSHVAANKPAKPKADAPKPKHLLGDWNKKLSDEGVDLTFKYEGDAAAVVSGGKRRGADYAQQLEFDVKADWGKIAGAKGLSSTITFVNREIGRAHV